MNRIEALKWCVEELITWPSKHDELPLPPEGWGWNNTAVGFVLQSERTTPVITKSDWLPTPATRDEALEWLVDNVTVWPDSHELHTNVNVGNPIGWIWLIDVHDISNAIVTLKPYRDESSYRPITQEDWLNSIHSPVSAYIEMTESDPNGIDQHTVGAKLDAGKNRLDLVLGGFSRALTAVGEVGTFGANKYTDNGWMEVPDGRNRYSDALLRHYFKDVTGEVLDPDSQLTHAAHLAWNALARLELLLRETDERA